MGWGKEGGLGMGRPYFPPIQYHGRRWDMAGLKVRSIGNYRFALYYIAPHWLSILHREECYCHFRFFPILVP
jgi:hypothetical protein